VLGACRKGKEQASDPESSEGWLRPPFFRSTIADQLGSWRAGEETTQASLMAMRIFKLCSLEKDSPQSALAQSRFVSSLMTTSVKL
jgi:hypothetical protein